MVWIGLLEFKVSPAVDLIGFFIEFLTGSVLVGVEYKPLFESSKSAKNFTIIHAPHVISNSGTGLVHLAPAHGAEDYNAFRALGMISPSDSASGKLVCHVDGKGQFTTDVAEVLSEDDAKLLVGRDVLYSGNKTILHLLHKLGKVVETEKITHKYPFDWRTKKPIIVM